MLQFFQNKPTTIFFSFDGGQGGGQVRGGDRRRERIETALGPLSDIRHPELHEHPDEN